MSVTITLTQAQYDHLLETLDYAIENMSSDVKDVFDIEEQLHIQQTMQDTEALVQEINANAHH